MSIYSDRKRLPTCVIFKCDVCDMTYGINHNYVACGISEYAPIYHACPECKQGKGAHDIYQHIPLLKYELEEGKHFPKKLFGNPMNIGYYKCINCGYLVHRLGENFCIHCGLTDEEMEGVALDSEVANIHPSPA